MSGCCQSSTSSSCACSRSAGCSRGGGTARFAPPGIQHFDGDVPCPDCGDTYDPVTGYCTSCEGELRLYRVAAFSAEWLRHTEDQPPPAPAVTVSARNVPDAVRLLLEDAQMLTVQRQD